MQHYSAIILAGGKGLRFGSSIAKQFLLLQRRPIFIYTIQQFQTAYPSAEIILVVPNSMQDEAKMLLHTYKIENVNLTIGGETRFQSVKNGLANVQENATVIGVHDAVRPLVDIDVIKTCFTRAEKEGSAIPVVPVVNSIRKVNGAQSRAVNRSNFVSVQTPQCFKASWIQTAYKQSFQEQFTDDASVVEESGYKLTLVDGNVENIKITTPQDLQLAELILSNKKGTTG